MNKVFVLVAVVVAIAGAASTYYFVNQSADIQIGASDAGLPDQRVDAHRSTRPPHGDFEHRFEPKPPPTDSKKVNNE